MKTIIVCGGGIMGSSVAYHLAKKGVKCLVVEQENVACAASGKAGGFLARDWSNGTEIEELCRTSFDLHMKLMEEFTDCDYRKLDTLSLAVKEGGKQKKGLELPPWISGPVTQSSSLGDVSTTAQVHPFKLTNKFISKAKELVGTEVKKGKVTGLDFSDNKVRGVKVNNEVIPADVVVIAMGPWTGEASKWLDIPRVSGHRAHSIVVKPPKEVTPHALFIEYSGGSGRRSPEVYPRPDGTVYICGMSDDASLPVEPALISPKKQSCETLKKMGGEISESLAEARVEQEQACFLPVSPSGVPLIGKVPQAEGVFIAAGHSCWGILNGPATGAALAELIVDGHSSVLDLSPFDPVKFMR